MTFKTINKDEELLEFTSSPIPQETAYGYLTDDQKQKLCRALQAPVHIVSKDTTASVSAPVHIVVSKVVESLKHLLALQQQRPSSPRHCVRWQAPSQQQVSIRGSGRFSYDSDMDFFIKSSQAPAPSSPGDFRNFCMAIMIAAFDACRGGKIQDSIECKDGAISARASSFNLQDRISGIFKSFFPFPDQSGCIFSFNTDGSHIGADVDITFHFRPSAPFSISPSTSPQLLTTALPPAYTIFSAEHTDWREMGARSFGHDASELVIVCDVKGRVDLAACHYFKALFGTNMDWVHKTLSSRILILLDTEMHLGYRRVFHEITKRGFIPPQSHAMEEGESLKLARVFSLVRENEYSKIVPGLDPMLQFVKSKSQSPTFTLHFFANAYKIAKMVMEDLTPANSYSLYAKMLLNILKREFLHDSWQAQFPDYVKEISQLANPLEIISEILQLKAHLLSFEESYEQPCFQGIARLSGRCDTAHGFIFTNALTHQQIKDKLALVEERTGRAILDKVLGDALVHMERALGSRDLALDMIFCLQRLSQQQLSPQEAKTISSHLPKLLSLAATHKALFALYPLEAALQRHYTDKAKYFIEDKDILTYIEAFIKENEKKGKNRLRIEELLHHLLPTSSPITSVPLDTELAEKMLALVLSVLKTTGDHHSSSWMAELLIRCIFTAQERQHGQILSYLHKFLAQGVRIHPLLQAATLPFFLSILQAAPSEGKRKVMDECLAFLGFGFKELIERDERVITYLSTKQLESAFATCLEKEDCSLLSALAKHSPSPLLSLMTSYLRSQEIDILDSSKLLSFLAKEAHYFPAKALFDTLFLYDPSAALFYASRAALEDQDVAKAAVKLLHFTPSLTSTLIPIMNSKQLLQLLLASSDVIDTLAGYDKDAWDALLQIFGETSLQKHITSSHYRNNLISLYLHDPDLAASSSQNLTYLIHACRTAKASEVTDSYHRLIETLKEHFFSLLAPSTGNLLLEEYFRLHQQQEHAATFITHITAQPTSIENIELIEQSIKHAPLSEESWQAIYTYVRDDVSSLQRLITAGYEKKCPSAVLHQAMAVLIYSCTSSEEKVIAARNMQKMGLHGSALYTILQHIAQDPESIHHKTMFSLCKALEPDQIKSIIATLLLSKNSRTHYHLLCLARSLPDPSETLLTILHNAFDKGPDVYQPLFDDPRRLSLLDSCLDKIPAEEAMQALYQKMVKTHIQEPIRWLQFASMAALYKRLSPESSLYCPLLMEAFFPYLHKQQPQLVIDYLSSLDAPSLASFLSRFPLAVLEHMPAENIIKTFEKEHYVISDTKVMDNLIKASKEQVLSIDAKMQCIQGLSSCISNPEKLFPFIVDTMKQARKERCFAYFFFAATHLFKKENSKELEREKKKIKNELDALFENISLEDIPHLCMIAVFFNSATTLDQNKMFFSLLAKITSLQEVSSNTIKDLEVLFSTFIKDLQIHLTAPMIKDCSKKLRDFFDKSSFSLLVEHLSFFEQPYLQPYLEDALYPAILKHGSDLFAYVASTGDAEKNLFLMEAFFTAFAIIPQNNLTHQQKLRSIIKGLLETCPQHLDVPAKVILLSLLLQMEKNLSIPFDESFTATVLDTISLEDGTFSSHPVFHIALCNIASAAKKPDILLPLLRSTFDSDLFLSLPAQTRDLLIQTSLCRTLPQALENKLDEHLDIDPIFKKIIKLFSLSPAKASYLPTLITLLRLHVQKRQMGHPLLDSHILNSTLTILHELIDSRLAFEHLYMLMDTLAILSKEEESVHITSKPLIKELTLKILHILTTPPYTIELQQCSSLEASTAKSSLFMQRYISLHLDKLASVANNLSLISAEGDKAFTAALTASLQDFFILLDKSLVGGKADKTSSLITYYARNFEHNIDACSALLRSLFLLCRQEDIYEVQMHRCRILTVIGEALQQITYSEKPAEEEAVISAKISPILKELTTCLYSVLETTAEQRTENRAGHIKDILTFGVKGYTLSPEQGVFYLCDLVWKIFEKESLKETINLPVIGMSLTAIGKIMEFEKHPAFAMQACHATCQRIIKFITLNKLSKQHKLADNMRRLEHAVLISAQGTIKMMLTEPLPPKKGDAKKP